jgi:hypothetical protein
VPFGPLKMSRLILSDSTDPVDLDSRWPTHYRDFGELELPNDT